MTDTKKVYSKEFKGKAVELSEVRGNKREGGHKFGISPELLYRWRSEFRRKPNEAFRSNGNKQLTEG
jgi:transposase